MRLSFTTQALLIHDTFDLVFNFGIWLWNIFSGSYFCVLERLVEIGEVYLEHVLGALILEIFWALTPQEPVGRLVQSFNNKMTDWTVSGNVIFHILAALYNSGVHFWHSIYDFKSYEKLYCMVHELEKKYIFYFMKLYTS